MMHLCFLISGVSLQKHIIDFTHFHIRMCHCIDKDVTQLETQTCLNIINCYIRRCHVQSNPIFSLDVYRFVILKLLEIQNYFDCLDSGSFLNMVDFQFVLRGILLFVFVSSAGNGLFFITILFILYLCHIYYIHIFLFFFRDFLNPIPFKYYTNPC